MTGKLFTAPKGWTRKAKADELVITLAVDWIAASSTEERQAVRRALLGVQPRWRLLEVTFGVYGRLLPVHPDMAQWFIKFITTNPKEKKHVERALFTSVRRTGRKHKV